jgi:hypothetical protein
MLPEPNHALIGPQARGRLCGDAFGSQIEDRAVRLTDRACYLFGDIGLDAKKAGG